MKRHQGVFVLAFLGLAILMAGCWGSSKSTSLDVATAPTPAKVGSEQCTNTCHAVTVDVTGDSIAAAWSAPTNIHTQDGLVQCEDCHGGGGNHWGVGPIPFRNPQPAQCLVCHGDPNSGAPFVGLGFDNTAHANAHIPGGFFGPDAFFFQGDAGTGQATNRLRGSTVDEPEFLPDGITPVNKAQHIDECSRCHNPSERFDFNRDGSLAKPDPGNMPNPVVTCASCHDAHSLEKAVAVATRTDTADYPIFRNFIVDNNVADVTFGAQVFDGTGAAVRGSIFQPNGAVQPDGSVNIANVVGTNNELSVERLCASCHTVGLYKYQGLPTHQDNVFAQWSQSAHGTRSDPAFAEFSAHPAAYTNPNTGQPYTEGTGSHQSLWPYDMALGSTTGGSGKVGATASLSQNAGVPGSSAGSFNNNFQCYKCHNGLTSIDYQFDVQGTPDAHVVFGDEPVTCVTCHEPHSAPLGLNTKNLRAPLVMSKYNSGGLVFAGNVFFDNTAVPAGTGIATVCVFCHQGRESGFTLFKLKLAAGKSITGNFFNPHYLGTAAMLWGKNGYEYTDNTTGTPVGKLYGVNTFHQQTNCFGCHMAPGKNADGTDNESVGGHTWKIVSDDDALVNSATCNAAACHNGSVPTTNAAGQFDNLFDSTYPALMKDYDGDGVANGIAVEIAGLESNLIRLLDNNGITYDDLSYPYFFIKGTATGYSNWTPAQLKAAFNLSFVIKGLPAEATSQIGEPNPSAATHNFRYNIELLMDSYADLYSKTLSPDSALPLPAAILANRPAGTRAATNYNPQPGGGYDPLQ